MVDLILKIDPSLKDRVVYINKRSKKERIVLYWEMNRAVYLVTLSSVLFYQNIAMQIEKRGFDINLTTFAHSTK